MGEVRRGALRRQRLGCNSQYKEQANPHCRWYLIVFGFLIFVFGFHTGRPSCIQNEQEKLASDESQVDSDLIHIGRTALPPIWRSGGCMKAELELRGR